MTSSDLFILLQIVFAVSGAILAARFWLAERGRPYEPKSMPLAAWNIQGWDFAICAIRVGLMMLVALLLSFTLLSWLKPHAGTTDVVALLITNASLQGGLVLGVLYNAWMESKRPIGPWETPEALGHPPRLPWKAVPLAGLATFLVTFAAVFAVTYVWRWLLEVAKIPAPEQDMLELLRSTDSSWVVVVVLVLATVFAPISEEGIFRAGIFRFARTRLPRWLALLMPATVFAAIHYSLGALPGLILLALIFSLAYERTGRIAVPMIAHALFNLNTIVQALLPPSAP